MCPMTAVEVFFPDMAITSILMADQIPTIFGRETVITQPLREAPVVAVEADAPVHVPALVPVAAALVAARKIATERRLEQAYNNQNCYIV